MPVPALRSRRLRAGRCCPFRQTETFRLEGVFCYAILEAAHEDEKLWLVIA
jgi:hypothetical protein